LGHVEGGRLVAGQPLGQVRVFWDSWHEHGHATVVSWHEHGFAIVFSWHHGGATLLALLHIGACGGRQAGCWTTTGPGEGFMGFMA
jgi:hypothetical protein